MASTVTITTQQVRIPPESIPAEMTAVTYRRTPNNVWEYRYHRTERAAKIAHGKNDRAYDRDSFQEWGWKVIADGDRRAGLWLW